MLWLVWFRLRHAVGSASTAALVHFCCGPPMRLSTKRASPSAPWRGIRKRSRKRDSGVAWSSAAACALRVSNAGPARHGVPSTRVVIRRASSAASCLAVNGRPQTESAWRGPRPTMGSTLASVQLPSSGYGNRNRKINTNGEARVRCMWWGSVGQAPPYGSFCLTRSGAHPGHGFPQRC